jgi:DNA-binding MarR family transcriptional regulator
MTTDLHTDLDDRMATFKPDGPGQTPLQSDPAAATTLDRDRRLLEMLVHVSLRLRLRGVDLESSTGLHGRELDLVALLTASGPTSVKSLVADLGLPRSTMTAIVDRLQERGLVNRHPNPQDRRSVVLEATPAAVDALQRYQEGMQGLVEHIKRVLPDAERGELTRLVGMIADTF